MGDRVAVYIDFDNVVISRYDQLHGRESWRKDEARRNEGKSIPKLEQARVDIGAILDYASSFGTIVISRAYADWSQPVNALYQRQLIGRAVDLTQMFPTSAGLVDPATPIPTTTRPSRLQRCARGM